MTKNTLKDAILQKLRINCGCTPQQAGDGDMLRACAMVLRDIMAERNVTTREETDKEQLRQVHYLSLEFLMGRSLMKNAYNLGLVDALTQAVEETLAKANKTVDEIDYIVCHQANERIIRHVQRKYRGSENKFYMNIENYGNTSSASIPIALDEMMEKKLLKPGMQVLCVGFGAGLTWSGALIEV